MPVVTVDVEGEYAKNRDLKREDVKSLQEWAEKQPHLPKLSELQIILFLHSCYYSNEMAKNTIDTFYTVRSICPEMFANRNPANLAARNVAMVTPLPKPTPEGYRVILVRIMDCDPDKYVFTEQLKLFDMINMLWLHQEGTAKGQIIVVDQEGVIFGHLTKLGIMPMKKFLFYLQEAMPVRLKGLHFINIVPFIDKIMALMKPFMKKELMDMLHLHSKIDTLFKFVPRECLPRDYGGTAESLSILHGNQNKNLLDNTKHFSNEENQVADESRRPGKPKSASDIFGVEGTFKRLDID